MWALSCKAAQFYVLYVLYVDFYEINKIYLQYQKNIMKLRKSYDKKSRYMEYKEKLFISC